MSVTPYGGFGLTRDLKANPDTACPVILILDRFQDEWLGRWSGADALVNRPVDPFALAQVASRLLAEDDEEQQGEATLEGATLVSIPARCGSCRRELLLDQLLQPSDGFRCPFCGFAFAPSYATVAPGLAARILDSHGALVRALAELQSMVDGRLQLDRAAVVAPVADALPAEPQPA